MFDTALSKVFGTNHDREIKRLRPIVAQVNDFEDRISSLTDAELKAKTAEFKRRIERGETLDDLMPEAFAVCRETGKRAVGMRHYDVQLIGGKVLHDGKIAEMKNRRGQDARRDARGLLECAGRQGRPRRHRQRLPRPTRRRVDGQDLSFPWHDGWGDCPRSLGPRTPRRLRGRHHLRDEQRVWVRLPARQHEVRLGRLRPARAQLRHRR